MTGLELYKFISDNKIEWHRLNNNGAEDVVILPSFSQMDAFSQILSPCMFDDEGIQCNLKHGYLAIWMRDICEYYGIEMNNVFKGKNCEYV